MLEARKRLGEPGQPPTYFSSIDEANSVWQLKVEEACSAVNKVHEAIKERRRQQAEREQERREVYAQTLKLTEKYGEIKVTSQKYGLGDFPDVAIAVKVRATVIVLSRSSYLQSNLHQAADEAIQICKQELSARNPAAAKTAMDMASRAVSQMEMVVCRAHEQHEWELPQRKECEEALNQIQCNLRDFVEIELRGEADFQFEEFMTSNDSVEEIFRGAAETIDKARRSIFSQVI